MTFTTAKIFSLVALLVFAATALFAFVGDAPNLAHLIGGVGAGLAVLAAGTLVA